MDRIEKDGVINYSVRSLDLRNVKEQAADARRKLANERYTAVKTMGTPILRPLTASAATALANSVANTMIRPGTASLTASSTSGFGSSALSASALQATTNNGNNNNNASTSFSNGNNSSSSSSSSSPSTQLVTTSTNQTIMELAALHAKCNYLETSLEQLCRSFISVLSSSSSSGAGQEMTDMYYTVEFGPGPIGMILTTSAEGLIEVAELRDDKEGRPLLAKASGKIKVQDTVIAINNHVLNRHGNASLETVALEFKGATRPVTVLFQRKKV